MSNILVLSGGTSNEREVSLRSGAAVRVALESAGHKVTTLDPRDNSIEEAARPDVVFPALHGAGGEDGAIQAEMERLGLPFVGSDSKASALCFDKWAYKQTLRHAGLPTPEAIVVSKENIWQSPLTRKPYVLKPIKGGSSVDMFIVRDPATADKTAMETTLAGYGTMLLEELIGGIELTLGVLGDQALPAIEIIPPQGAEFDYDNKYNGKTRELCPPQNVDNDTQREAQTLALTAHRLTGCRDLSRTDIMVDKDANLWILETNTLPGMTDQSLFPKAGAVAGIPMDELTNRLVKMALSRA